MTIDALAVTALVDELRATILGGRVQHVLLPSPVSIGLEIFNHGRRHQLLASANPRAARLHLAEAKPSRGVEHDTPLLLLLRKYVRGGVITAVEQPELERIVMLSITKYPGGRKDDDEDELLEDLSCELVVELIGSRANLILVDDNNLVLHATKLITEDASGRSILPRVVYTLPPRPAGRLDPREATPGVVASALARSDDPARGLTAVFDGVSPQLAREALARAAQASEQPEPAGVAAELRGLFEAPFAPSLAYDDDDPVAFAPYRLTQFADVRPIDSISRAIEIFFESGERLSGHAQKRDQLLAQLRELRTRYARQLESIERELQRAEALETLRWEGEMIYGFLHALEPGQRVLEVEGRAIKLDPTKTPVENAQGRFREYDKAKGALADLPERRATTLGQLDFVDETLALLELAEGYEAIAMIERELIEQGLIGRKDSKPKGPRAAPLRLRSSEGTTILVGRSAGQNEQVTFQLARPDDLWLHARGVPGAHVVVQVEGDVGDTTIREAAGLAVYFSKARNETAAEVSLCLRRNVRKVPAGPPGLVTIRNEKSIRVPPVSPDQLRTA